MALAEVFPSGDGEVAAGAEAESPRIVELLKERRGGKSLPFGDSQLAAVAEEIVSDMMSAAMLRENALGDAIVSIVVIFILLQGCTQQRG